MPHWPIPYCSNALDSYAAGKGLFRLQLDWDRVLIVESTFANICKEITCLEKPDDRWKRQLVDVEVGGFQPSIDLHGPGGSLQDV